MGHGFFHPGGGDKRDPDRVNSEECEERLKEVFDKH